MQNSTPKDYVGIAAFVAVVAFVVTTHTVLGQRSKQVDFNRLYYVICFINDVIGSLLAKVSESRVIA